MERKPERLAEAVRAVGALVDNESAEEATRDIFPLMRAYGAGAIDDSPRGELIKASRQALWEMPPQVVVPAMIEEITSGNDSSRAFLTWMAVRPSHDTGSDMQRVEDVAREMKRRAGDVLSPVLALSRDDSANTQVWALVFAIEFCRANGIDPAEVEGLIPRFQEELASGDGSRIVLVSGLLVERAPDTEGLVDSLTNVLSDENAWNQGMAIEQLGQLGPRAAPAVPKLVSLLSEYLEDAGGPRYAPWQYGREASSNPVVEIIKTLGKIGPAAKAALPALQKALDGRLPMFHEHAKEAIAQIEGTPPDDEQ
jgi:hypothetical protein